MYSTREPYRELAYSLSVFDERRLHLGAKAEGPAAALRLNYTPPLVAFRERALRDGPEFRWTSPCTREARHIRRWGWRNVLGTSGKFKKRPTPSRELRGGSTENAGGQ